MFLRASFHIGSDMNIIHCFLGIDCSDKLIEGAMQYNVIFHQQVMSVMMLFCTFYKGYNYIGQQLIILMEKALQLSGVKKIKMIFRKVFFPYRVCRQVVEY